MTKSQLIKKIVVLSVCGVLCFIGAFFAPAKRPLSGKGGGTGDKVNNPAEFAAVYSSLPSVYEYMTEDPTESERVTATAYENTDMKVSHSVNGSYMRQSSDMKFTRELYIYYGQDSIYYHSVGLLWTKEEVEYKNSNISMEDKSVTVSFDFDVEFYISAEASYMKFNKYDYYTDDEEAENDKVRKGTFEAIQNHYGDWMKLVAVSDEPDSSAMASPDAAIEYMCNQIGAGVLDEVIETDGQNADLLKSLFGDLTNYEESFKKKNGVYVSVPVEISGHYINRCIDFTDKSAPVAYINYDVHESGNDVYESTMLLDKLSLSNINNTVVPVKPKKSVSMYKVFGDLVRTLLQESTEND